MSISINQKRCIGCGRCCRVCPGSLLRLNEAGKAFLPHPERCWGCTCCIKECPTQAAALYLGEDMGGLGGKMTVRREGTRLHWMVSMPDGSTKTIVVDSRNANQY
ncbi:MULTISPECIES: 4Fe-4S dicluster domain-containing protein [Caproicibacterium]|uniref:Ferredoxin family protein n=1 Tax=Caproicibacterium argilliputei TaxID=3030016 RepID=A0AA97DAA6_9FIRM|nr:ferredoxin family protein [Caproicibacterium argilliputei]WOC31716.1 ferredoxin family protein [Caproicibacterium argilliputei]